MFTLLEICTNYHHCLTDTIIDHSRLSVSKKLKDVEVSLNTKESLNNYPYTM